MYDEAAVQEYVKKLEKWNPIDVKAKPKYNFNVVGDEPIGINNFKTLDNIVIDYVEKKLELDSDMKQMKYH